MSQAAKQSDSKKGKTKKQASVKTLTLEEIAKTEEKLARTLERAKSGSSKQQRGQQVKRGADGYLVDLMAAILSPRTAPGTVRLADAYDTEPTTTLAPFHTDVVPLASTDAPPAGYTGLLPSNEGLIILAPFVTQNKIVYDPNLNGYTANYIAAIRPVGGVPLAGSVSVQVDVGSHPLEVAYWAYGTGVANSTPFHGNILPCNVAGDDTYKYVWLQIGDTISIENTAAVSGCGMGLRFWSGDEVTDVPGVPVLLGNSTITISAATGGNGFYAPYMTNTNPTAVTVANLRLVISFSSTSGHLCFLGAQSVFSTIGSFTDFRLIGQSLLVTNVAAELSKAGTIAQAQLGMNDHWSFYLPNVMPTAPAFGGTSVFSQIASLPRSDGQRAAKTGSYVWRKPACQRWSDYTAEFTVEGGVLMDTHVPLRPTNGAYIMWASDIPVDGRAMRFTVATYAEAKTTDVTRPTAVAYGNPLQVIELQAALRNMPQFSENPLHIPAILASLRSGVKTVAGLIASAAPTVGKIAKNIYEAL